MRITKFGHSCVRLEDGAGAVVIDPGSFTSREAVEGATAVLITHEHADHWTPDLLRATDAPVHTIAAVAAAIEQAAPDVADRVSVCAPGDRLELAGMEVDVVNEQHAVIHPEYPRVANSGYLVTAGGRTVFHPGDALDGPREGVAVDVLLMPASAPWAAAWELIEFGRRVQAPTNVAIHDRIYSDAGAAVFDTHVANFFPAAGLDFRRLADGEDL